MQRAEVRLLYAHVLWWEIRVQGRFFVKGLSNASEVLKYLSENGMLDGPEVKKKKNRASESDWKFGQVVLVRYASHLSLSGMDFWNFSAFFPE